MADYDYVVINGKKRPVHILIAEQMLGRPLEPDEVVHHINGNKHDNDESNLKIMKRDEHSRLHHTEARHGKETRDKIAASSKGRPGPNRCFNREQVREIADRLQCGERMADLAKKYGVDKNVIRNICIGKSYRDCLPELTDEAFPLQQPRKSRISSQRKIPIPELGEIRVELMAGEALSEIAERHHLAAATIMNIRDGDTIRFAACTAGYLSETADILTEKEIESLPVGAAVITPELARAQLALYRDMQKHMEEMRESVRNYK